MLRDQFCAGVAVTLLCTCVASADESNLPDVAFYLSDVKSEPSVGPGGALLDPPLDGEYVKKGNELAIHFPPNNARLGHQGVKVGDILRFSGYNGFWGYCQVEGFDRLGLRLVKVKRLTGFPEVDRNLDVIWINGWATVPGGVISLSSPRKGSPVVMECKRRDARTGEFVEVRKGALAVGNVFETQRAVLTVKKIVASDNDSRRLGWVEFSTKLLLAP